MGTAKERRGPVGPPTDFYGPKGGRWYAKC